MPSPETVITHDEVIFMEYIKRAELRLGKIPGTELRKMRDAWNASLIAARNCALRSPKLTEEQKELFVDEVLQRTWAGCGHI